MRGMGGIPHEHDGRALAIDLFVMNQVLQITRGKRIQIAEPRELLGIADEFVPVEIFAEQLLAEGDGILWLMASRPCAFHTSSGVSTMKVEVLPSNL